MKFHEIASGGNITASCESRMVRAQVGTRY